MCSLGSLFGKTPSIQQSTVAPTRSESVSNEDAVTSQLEQQKKRRGFQSTIATSGSGTQSQANTLKTQLGS